MKRLFVAISILLLTANASVFATPLGLLYTNIKEPVAVTEKGSYTKVAEGTTMSLLWLIGLGDASIEKIARDAGITTIKHVDKETTVFPLGIYIQEKYTVYGD